MAISRGQEPINPTGIVIASAAEFSLIQAPHAVLSVEPDGPADRRGLRARDTITAVNNTSVLHFSPRELTAHLLRATQSGPVTARISRTRMYRAAIQ